MKEYVAAKFRPSQLTAARVFLPKSKGSKKKSERVIHYYISPRMRNQKFIHNKY